MKIARKTERRATKLYANLTRAVANHFNSGTEFSVILGSYKCGADLLDDQEDSLLERAGGGVDERFSALDERNLCIEDEIVRDETASAPVELSIFVDDRTGDSTGE